MKLADEIQKSLIKLPQAKQLEVLDFIEFLNKKCVNSRKIKPDSLKNHKAFGSWKKRKLDGLQFQESLRSEWEE